MTTIFISYKRTDKVCVELLERQIHNIYGYGSLWYDRSIEGGDYWWQKIVSEIRDCQLFLFLMSDLSVESEYCRKELQEAIYNQKTVLPVLLETYTRSYPDNLPETLSEEMKKVHYVDLRNGYCDLSKLWGAINRNGIGRFLSKTDRWILYNQFEILQMLSKNSNQPGNADEYKNYQEIISAGYEWNYDQISQHIEPPVKFDKSEDVIAILEMYRAIHNACEHDVNCAGIELSSLRFRGFDGNHEADYYNFAKYIIESEGRFDESKPNENSDLNSHYQMLPKYQKMLSQWRLSPNPNSLTKEDIVRILNA